MADSKEEQALKARVLAERCFIAGNVAAARQWMLSALRLAPDLLGNAQVAAAYDVHATAARSPLDWHDVLGLPRRSGGGGAALTRDAIKKQHRKLCLLVHPDKNPSAAADGAFKLIQAAFDALTSCPMHPPANASASTPHARPQTSPSPSDEQQRQRAPRQRRERRWRWVSPPHPAPRRPTRPSAGVCPVCGAVSPYGKRNLRCMSCHWTAKGQSYVNDHDCFKYDYYN
ncbi:hypothetical protein EJB05_05978, partial [Eragrostis curvula]